MSRWPIHAIVAAISATSSPASASESAPQLGALAEALMGEVVAVDGAIGAVGLGYAPTTSLSVTAEVGYTWGHRNTGLLGETHLLHVTLRPAVAWDLEKDAATHYRLPALLGYSAHGIATYGGAVGAELQYGDRWRAGPTVLARLAVGHVGVYATATVAFPATEAHAVIGVELLGAWLR